MSSTEDPGDPRLARSPTDNSGRDSSVSGVQAGGEASKASPATHPGGSTVEGLRSGGGEQLPAVPDAIASAYVISKSIQDPNTGCWNWTGGVTTTGYARCKCFGEQRASRVSYAAFKGPIGNLYVLHSCDNPLCVNPEHLRLGTHKDNAIDRSARERHGRMKLTTLQVLAIRAETVKSGNQLAADYGVSCKLIRQIRKGRLWTHL